MPARLIVTTVGTSLSGNLRLDPEPRQSFRARLARRLDELRERDGELFLVRLSAELNVLAKIGFGRDDLVWLLATDTDDGRRTADLLADLVPTLLDTRERPHIETVPGLQVGDATDFRRRGLRNLYTVLERATRTAEQRNLALALNINGGYKSLMPLVSLYGMMREVPIYYAYEQTPALLTLPPLPLTIDWERIGPAAEALIALRAAGNLMRWQDFAALLPERGAGHEALLALLVEREGDMVAPSLTAELMLARLGDRAARLPVVFSTAALNVIERIHDAPLMLRALEEMHDPLQRRVPRHRDRVARRSDLLIWKTHGHGTPRFLYRLDGEVMQVARVFADHDDYDRNFLRGENVMAAQFDFDSFRPRPA